LASVGGNFKAGVWRDVHEAHLTFVEPAFWLGWVGKTMIQNAARRKEDFRRILSIKARRDPRKGLENSRIKIISSYPHRKWAMRVEAF
jgi:hypothetical protein